MKHRKIGILTFHWADDYGAMLQAYGLKATIAKMGYAVEMIPYAPYRLVGRYWIWPYVPQQVFDIRGMRKQLRLSVSIFKFNIKNSSLYHNKRNRMQQFRKTYLTEETKIRSAKNIPTDRYSTVFVGSDQVWNPVLTIGFDRAYMGDVFCNTGCRIVSYGASLGGSNLLDKYTEEFREKLTHFQAISLREQSAVEYVEKLYDRAVSHVVDPALLPDVGDWEKLMVMPREREYILIYETSLNKSLEAYAKGLAECTGKQVIRLVSSLSQARYGCQEFKTVADIGPAEFLGYIRSADYVVTNSFHGTVFSTIFRKKFVVFGFRDRSARMQDFLQEIGMEKLFCNDTTTDYDLIMRQETDWDRVADKLTEMKQQSIEYISEQIELGDAND